MVNETHISGVVVYLRPEYILSVRQVIEGMASCEIASEDASGKLVLVLEAGGSDRITDMIERIQGLAGVINVVMAYHHCEADAALNEEYA